VEDAVSEGDHETSRCTVRATNANDQTVTFSGMTFLRVKNNKIVEAWNNFDFLSMYQQLGFKMALQEEVV
jgi:predicted ester cyclase